MATFDIAIAPLMFAAIKTGAWTEVVCPRQREDFKHGDVLCFREVDASSRYTDAPPIVYRITSVANHFSDDSRIPSGFYLVGFEPIPPVVNPPVHQYTPIAKDARIPATPRPPTRWPF
jgi:hypothetical protein